MNTNQQRLLPSTRRAAGPAARRDRAADLPARPRPSQAQAQDSSWTRLLAAPNSLPSDQEQAAHELDLAAALVLAMPTAAASLALLTNSQSVHPEGALVLGALLYVSGHRDGSQFWLQFAAGGGNHTAASLLSLLHRSLGEVLDAETWRRQADTLADAREQRTVQEVLDPSDELLPRAVRADIIARCHEGLDVRLPPRVAAVLHQLPIDSDDPEYGEVPQVSASLVRALAAAV
ncbi:hypothetical protein [Streptomyces sp. SUK 48]|uniref:hypothetical protein n=1 Tax=Streptomyces sp. SUK 48 TaxID=2582831 RepID=UPI001FBBC219|nr:hypothetical protein [Streptomyces sp. SUK 48]